MANPNPDPNPILPEVSKVAARLPPFWKSNPRIWFTQTEANFAVAGITNDVTKYHSVIGAIDGSVLVQVGDIFTGPVEKQTYANLKERLITQFAESEETQLKILLQEIALDDKKPSTLLREMRALAGAAVTEELLKSLWIQRLPQQIRVILSINESGLDNMAKQADKIAEVTPQRGIDATESCSSANNNDIRNELADLRSMIEKLSLRENGRETRREQGRSGTRDRSVSRYRSKSYNRQHFRNNNFQQNDNDENICYYHNKWGNKAKKCKPHCHLFKDFARTENSRPDC